MLNEIHEGMVAPGERKDHLAGLKAACKLSDDKEMQTKIAIVTRLGGRLPPLLERLRQVDVGTKLGSAHYLLSTAHKAKGLEFPTVVGSCRLNLRNPC